MNKKFIPFIVAFALSCFVMLAAGAFSLSGMVNADKFVDKRIWSVQFGSAESMKAIDLNGDGQEDLFIQNQQQVAAYDANANLLWSFDYAGPKTTLGDVDGDGVQDVIVFSANQGMSVDVISKGQVRTIAQGLWIGTPARVAMLRLGGVPEIILGDTQGKVLAISPEGQTLWNATVGSEEIRGMDDAKINGETYVAIAAHDGNVMLFDGQGKMLWSDAKETLRRMRAFDLNGDGNSEIITGGEYGTFVIYNAADGKQLFNQSLGQPVSEVREVELNGDPSAHEIVAGGKDGGVWAFSFDGSTAHQMWTGSLGDKVTEIAGLDVDGDGKQEAVIGTDGGEVALFTANGTRHSLPSHSYGITRIDIAKFNGERMVVVADGYEVDADRVTFSSLPGFRYTPLVVGLIFSAVLLIIAAILASIPPKPEMKVSFQDKSRESLEAERRMLKESIADVERLRKSGEVTGEAYLARLKQLRGDLAENEAAFKTAGFPIKVETFQCPNCGGTLELGMDKCEYCGQLILS